MTALPAQDVAVVDVGSNSVRLVVYRLEGRAIWTVYNEKVLAGLGRDLATTGRLSPEGAAAALIALRRFRAVLDGGRPSAVHTAATAAVREAEDGPAFVARVRATCGFDLRVLSGEDEARGAAMGVVAGDPLAVGVVGDLGGSSLELNRVADGQVDGGVSLPLGPFAIGGPRDDDPLRRRKEILRRLDGAADRFRASTFHAVGGAWRNLGLLQMRLSGYPLHVIHQYELSAAEALDVARLVGRQSRSSLERIRHVSKRRLETLPHAALLLEALIERMGFERIVFSAYGVREGLIHEAMDAELRARDPLVEGCAALGARMGAAEGLGQALDAWLSPLSQALPPVFPPERHRTLLAGACRLADMGARLHPDHRAALTFDQVVRAPIAGQTHAERAYLATAVFTRYEADDSPPGLVERLLPPERLQRARALGLALRLGCDLSGRSPALLAASGLQMEDRRLVLTARPGQADLLLSEQSRKRLNALADQLELEPVMRAL